MITSIHTLIYSDDPPATRAFLRDVLGWPHVEHAESEQGWLMLYQPHHPTAYDL